jgi:hypothetical protein
LQRLKLGIFGVKVIHDDVVFDWITAAYIERRCHLGMRLHRRKNPEAHCIGSLNFVAIENDLLDVIWDV